MILIGSHEPKDLDQFREMKNMQPCLFSEIENSELRNPERFAESQALFGANSDLLKGKYAGLVSPRFTSRYPKWPGLQEIDELISANEKQFEINQILAPQAFKCKVKNLKYWYALQDLAHPGMGKILMELQMQKPSHSQQNFGSLVMGNTFIMRNLRMTEFINNWKNFANQMDLNLEETFKYSYRCLKCGMTSNSGIGRWGANRHPAYLMERITALSIFDLEDLHVCKLKNSRISRRILFPINKVTYSLILVGHFASILYFKITRASCNHVHVQPGKIG